MITVADYDRITVFGARNVSSNVYCCNVDVSARNPETLRARVIPCGHQTSTGARRRIHAFGGRRQIFWSKNLIFVPSEIKFYVSCEFYFSFSILTSPTFRLGLVNSPKKKNACTMYTYSYM